MNQIPLLKTLLSQIESEKHPQLPKTQHTFSSILKTEIQMSNMYLRIINILLGTEKDHMNLLNKLIDTYDFDDC